MSPPLADPALDSLLARGALDALDDDERLALERALGAEPVLHRELDAYRTGARALAAVAPAPSVRERLLASVDALIRPGRLDAQARALGDLLDVTVDKARMFLGWIDEPARWQPTGLPGIDCVRLPAGPAWAAADCRLLRMAPGSRFPRHAHDGRETTLVLDGHARFDDGTELGPGDLSEAAPGAEHAVAVDDEACTFAVRGHGIRILPPRR